ERVPVAAPDELDDIPAAAPEIALEFLDDFSVATHRAVKALKIAVDDENEIVELLAGGQADGAQRFRFVHFAVAAEDPHLALAGVGNAAGMQVLEKTRLVNGHERPQAHGHRRELPEIGHEFGMRVRRQTLAVDLLAEVVQLLFGEAAFKEGTTIDARRRVPLEIHQITAVILGFSMPEMVLAAAYHGGQRGERRDVAAEIAAIG